MFINIHSHHHTLNNNQWVIQNLHEHFEKVEISGSYSIGLHPWFLKEDNWKIQYDLLERYAKSDFVFAIGECGLDKNCDTDFLLQKNIFTAQVILANNLKKPLIIHCVNAYEEIKKLLKAYNNHVPVIFHGFNKNENIARTLISEGFFLSFGKALMKQNIQILLKKLSLENIFFETDDDTITIEEVYLTAEKSLSIDTETLELKIKKNAIKLFGDGLF